MLAAVPLCVASAVVDVGVADAVGVLLVVDDDALVGALVGAAVGTTNPPDPAGTMRVATMVS